MRLDFTYRMNGNRRLLLIFPGWSTPAPFYDDIEVEGWDKAIAVDYSDLSFDISELDGYATIYLYAWSLGVAFAAATIPGERITAAYAVNGSQMPVSDSFGIPEKIFSGTAENLSKESLLKFQKRMFGSSSSFRENLHRLDSDPDIERLKSELAFFLDNRDAFNRPFPWNRIYIGNRDMIFPAENLRQAWSELHPCKDVVVDDSPHFISLKKIVSSTINSIELVRTGFSKAVESYESNASAQKIAAENLIAIVREQQPFHADDILEIGSGTGLFTRMIVNTLHPKNLVSIDLLPIKPETGFVDSHIHYSDDAEKWISDTSDSFDCILSSSTMQWFYDIREFLKNCSSHLNRGGRFFASLYIKGNLHELDAFRPTPLNYVTTDRLRKWMSEFFTDCDIKEETITLNFRNGKEALLHLKKTGVAGGKSVPGLKISDISDLKTLTYKVAYLIARKQ